MRNFLLILFLHISVASLAQWQELTPDTEFIHQRLFFNSPSKGIAVGQNGIYQRTYDGGTTWDTSYIQFDDWSLCQRTPYPSDLNSVFFPSDTVGYFGGQDGDLFKTTDGGTTWFCQSMLPTWDNVHELYFFNNDTGIAATFYTVFRTTDGGVTWSCYLPPIWPNRFCVISDSIVLSAGDEIWRSTDYGLTWLMMNADTLLNYTDISFGDDLTGVATSHNGKVVRTTDGGITWSAPYPVTPDHITNVEMISDSFGIITAGDNWWSNWQQPDIGYVLYTFDGGVTWLQPDTIGTKTMMDLFIVNDSTAITCGWLGNVMKNDQLTPSYILGLEQTEIPPTPVVFPVPAKESIYVTLPGVPVTAQAEIIITDMNGRVVKPAVSFWLAPYEVNIADLSSGVYFLHCTVNGVESVSKFIVQ